MVEADIQQRLLLTSILETYKVFEVLACRLMGIWMHHYTVPPAKLVTDFGIFDHLWRGNDAISSWLGLTSTSDCIPHPY
jgi:hypothetical protein